MKTPDFNPTRHERLKAELRISGSSLADIARELGLKHSTVGSVSRGISTSHRVQKAIAEKLGLRPEELWPARYPDHVDRKDGGEP